MGPHVETQPLTFGPQPAPQPIVDLDRDVGQHPKLHVLTVTAVAFPRQGANLLD
jgi:hypothetical protein